MYMYVFYALRMRYSYAQFRVKNQSLFPPDPHLKNILTCEADKEKEVGGVSTEPTQKGTDLIFPLTF